jgi:hypothetical protein
MSQFAHAAVEALRERGYAVAIFAPADLNDRNPEEVEERMRESALCIIQSSDVLDYLVIHYQESEAEEQEFECSATDINQVVELFESQFPEHTIKSIELQ